MRQFKHIPALLTTLAFALSGCGTKGPLTLPPKTPPATAATAAPVPATPQQAPAANNPNTTPEQH